MRDRKPSGLLLLGMVAVVMSIVPALVMGELGDCLPYAETLGRTLPCEGVFLAELSDTNGNGSPEFAVLYRKRSSGMHVARIVDAATGEILRNLTYGREWGPAALMRARDVDGNGIDELVMYGIQDRTATCWHSDGCVYSNLIAKDPATGDLVSQVTMSRAYIPTGVRTDSLLVNGNTGAALLHSADVRWATRLRYGRLQIADLVLGMVDHEIRYQPTEIVPMLALFGNDRAAVLTKTGGEVMVKLKQVSTGETLKSFLIEDIVDPLQMSSDRLPDVDVLTVMGLNTSGKVRIETRAVPSGKRLGKIGFGQITPLGMVMLEDLDGSGDGEVAVLFETASGKFQVRVKDTRSGDLLSVLNFPPNYPPAAFIRISDTNGNGWPELAVAGRNADGRIRAHLKDARSGESTLKVLVQSANPEPTAIVVFSSGGVKNTDLDGRSGADDICMDKITRNPLGGQVADYPRAFLSVSRLDQMKDVAPVAGWDTELPVKGPNGTVLAEGWSGMWDGFVTATLEDAGIIPAPGNEEKKWLTGSSRIGTAVDDGHCRNWRDDGSIGNKALVGRMDQVNFSWITERYHHCEIASVRHYELLCVVPVRE